MSKYGTPKRTAHDHPYAKASPQKTQPSHQKKQIDLSLQPKSSTANIIVPEKNTSDPVSTEVSTSDSELSGIDVLDPIYVPTGTETEDISDDDSVPNVDINTVTEKKYIVFESNLEELMKFCKMCGAPVETKERTLNGSCVAYTLGCLKGCSYVWRAQPNVSQQQPSGNLLLSAAIALAAWIQSITNHLWWSAASCQDDEQLLKYVIYFRDITQLISLVI